MVNINAERITLRESLELGFMINALYLYFSALNNSVNSILSFPILQIWN